MFLTRRASASRDFCIIFICANAYIIKRLAIRWTEFPSCLFSVVHYNHQGRLQFNLSLVLTPALLPSKDQSGEAEDVDRRRQEQQDDEEEQGSDELRGGTQQAHRVPRGFCCRGVYGVLMNVGRFEGFQQDTRLLHADAI